MTKKSILAVCTALLLTSGFFFSCSKDEESTLKLTLSETTMQTESGTPIKVGIDVVSNKGIKNIVIEKTVNNQVDQSFQKLTINPATAGATSLKDTFRYTPAVSDTNKLVGFKFTVTDNNNSTSNAFLAVQVTLSPKDNFTRKSWKCYSVLIWSTAHPTPEEVGAAVDFDNVLTFNTDSTYKENWGTIKGTFDDFFTPVKWRMVIMGQDTILYRSVKNAFTAEITTKQYYVTELKIDKITLEERDVDMTPLGGDAHSTFAYKYKAVPKE